MAHVSLIDNLNRWRQLVRSLRMSHTCHTLIISVDDADDHQRTLKRPKRQPNSKHRVVSVIGNVEGVGIVPGVSLVGSSCDDGRLCRSQCTSNHVKSRHKRSDSWAGKRATCAHASSSARSPSIDLGFFAEVRLALQLRRAAVTRTEREQRLSEAIFKNREFTRKTV